MIRALTLSVALLAPPSWATESVEDTKRAPDIEQSDIDALFGSRLDAGERQDNLLLLAMAFDHQSESSPTRDQNIGIPFIVDAGAGYWVRALQEGDTNLNVLVNNALLLLYLNEPGASMEERRHAADLFMQVASSQGYWPADVYLVERAISGWTDQVDAQIPLVLEQATISEVEREALFNRLSSCARIRFAPCMFRLGFWYLTDPSKQEAGEDLLRGAVEIARRDRRYLSSAESMMDMQAALTVFQDPMITMPDDQREAYIQLAAELPAMIEELRRD